MMYKNSEKYVCDTNGFPKELLQKINVPKEIPYSGKKLLNPFLENNLFKPGVEIILLEDLNLFYNQEILSNNVDEHKQDTMVGGIYFSKNHPWVEAEHIKKMDEKLKEVYDLYITRGIILSMKNPLDYWKLIHESLHDAFTNLPQKERETIQKTLEDTITLNDALRFLSQTGCGILSLNERTIANNNSLNYEDLPFKKRIQLVDEYIAGFFTTAHIEGLTHDPTCMPEKLKETLTTTGYKINKFLKLSPSIFWKNN